MKKTILFITVIISLVLVSCKIDEGYNEQTPSILFGSPVKLNSDSSLYLKNTYELNVARLDSIHVGDTVILRIGMNAYYNQLTEFDYKVNDTSAIKTILSDSVKLLFKSMKESDGKYYFNDNYAFVVMPVQFVALKESDSIQYTFGVYSNVTRVTNYDEVGLKTKIKPAMP